MVPTHRQYFNILMLMSSIGIEPNFKSCYPKPVSDITGNMFEPNDLIPTFKLRKHICCELHYSGLLSSCTSPFVAIAHLAPQASTICIWMSFCMPITIH